MSQPSTPSEPEYVSLYIKGHAPLNVKDGFLCSERTDLKHSWSGQTLTVEAPSSSVVVNRNGVRGFFQSIFGSGNIVSTNGAITITKGGGGDMPNIQTSNRYIRVNGRVIDTQSPSYANDSPPTKKRKANPAVPFSLELQNKMIDNICVKGSGSVNFLDTQNIAQDLDLSVTGSGQIDLPRNDDRDSCLANLLASVTGSGSINVNGPVKAANLTVIGSGDILKFLILKKGNLSLTGSGDIRGSAASGARINKNCTGSGDIRVN